jgi:hypothetical protein
MPREGIALPIALAAIVVIGALIAGVFFASTQEYRVGRNTLAAHRAMNAAEVGLGKVVSSWTPARTTSTKLGQTVTMPLDTIDGSAVVQVQYTKVSPTVFWVTSTSVGGSSDLRARSLKRLNTIVRIQTPDFKIMGAVTSRGRTETAGASKISGSDSTAAGWDCPPAGPQGAGVVMNDSATNYVPSGTKFTINGTPKIKDSTALVKDTMTFTKFGGFSYDSLTKLATKSKTVGGTYANIRPTYKPDAVTCDTDNPDNWGADTRSDPAKHCDAYAPIVHLKGDNQTYTLNGNANGGQGILLVDGNLALAGQFKWTGLIIVRGSISITGNANDGPKVLGALAAMNRSNGTNLISGGSQVTFSRCVLNEVTARHATAAPTSYRAWADLSF